jgi:hypothetical protein
MKSMNIFGFAFILVACGDNSHEFASNISIDAGNTTDVLSVDSQIPTDLDAGINTSDTSPWQEEAGETDSEAGFDSSNGDGSNESDSGGDIGGSGGYSGSDGGEIGGSGGNSGIGGDNSGGIGGSGGESGIGGSGGTGGAGGSGGGSGLGGFGGTGGDGGTDGGIGGSNIDGGDGGEECITFQDFTNNIFSQSKINSYCAKCVIEANCDTTDYCAKGIGDVNCNENLFKLDNNLYYSIYSTSGNQTIEEAISNVIPSVDCSSSNSPYTCTIFKLFENNDTCGCRHTAADGGTDDTVNCYLITNTRTDTAAIYSFGTYTKYAQVRYRDMSNTVDTIIYLWECPGPSSCVGLPGIDTGWIKMGHCDS